MELRFEKNGTAKIDYSVGSVSIGSLIAQKRFEDRVEEFNELAKRRASDPNLEEEYQNAKTIVQGAYSILNGTSFGGALARQHAENQAEIALENLSEYAQDAGLSNTQQLRLRLDVTDFLRDRGRKITPENIDIAIESIAGFEARAVQNLYSRQEPECFVAGTVIELASPPANSGQSDAQECDFKSGSQPVTEKNVDEIVIGDWVQSFDFEGNIVPGKVVQVFRNTTTELLRLSWTDRGKPKELVTTPEHRFLDMEGGFPCIKDMVANECATIVSKSGELLTVHVERIVYNARTKHLFDQAYEKGVAIGSLAGKPEPIEAWQTYNFEVETYHTYIAGGVRVHNVSGDFFPDGTANNHTTGETYNHDRWSRQFAHHEFTPDGATPIKHGGGFAWVNSDGSDWKPGRTKDFSLGNSYDEDGNGTRDGRGDGGSSSSDDLVPVEFRVEKQVPYGEHLVITGSSNFMGGWDITQVRACIGTSLRGVECLGV